MEKTVKDYVNDIALRCADLIKYAEAFDGGRFSGKAGFNRDVRVIIADLKSLKGVVKEKQERKRNVKNLDFTGLE